ncbi:MAG: ABC-F family ATP-binding cassette domain-containing protein [Oscillospiraceae bacterium]|nr:ABC-F family ATP-binding cassette domain-containing protein [Oscillospiraceae bacterium]
MIELSVQNLKKSFEVGEILLDGLTFEIQTGECVGIMGRNGCGKTTLFRMLTGELEPDDGVIVFAPGRKIGLISQIPVYPEGYTVENVLRSAYRDLFAMKKRMEALEHQMTVSSDKAILSEYDRLTNAYEVGGGYDMDMNVDKICNGLGIPAAMRDRFFTQLSGGEKTRVNLARLLLENTDILLLDEPTNHLDLKSVEWLESYIKQFKGTTLTISHDRYFLDRVVDRIIEIRDGRAEHYNGNYSFYLEEKQARFNLQLKQYEQEQAKISQLSYTVERMKGWGINNRVLYRRAMAMQHRLERIRKTERPKTEKTLKARFGEKEFFGDAVFSVKDLSKRFGEKTLFSDVELHVEGGERIAILGDNGTGKTTFLRCLLGEEPVDAGRIRFGPTVKTAYLPQVMQFAHPERTLYDTMLYELNCTPQAARDRLGAFLFSGEDVFKTVGTLSGGEQSRLRLCMLMDEKINLLILDEPTNHLDIASREWVECAIEEYEGTLLFVSHDRYFVDKFATRIWELEDGQIKDYPCGYAKYRSLKENAAVRPIPQTAKPEKKDKPKAKVDSKALEKEVRRLEREIEKQEQRISELDEQLQAAATDYQELLRLTAEREAADADLNDLMAQWESAAEQLV